jgi:hypothetical protein
VASLAFDGWGTDVEVIHRLLKHTLGLTSYYQVFGQVDGDMHDVCNMKSWWRRR